ncbi:hypothetical protein F511_30337 [Dorcoceras hygrometricum]|uniref:Uncharacterized protein n=1 Tax=Dorcoceras hygrometricum TaxID=472368 RepID=A0A2Z7D808_9LAMI|nr:hypothetical protein F511_30337 [Dorcoceras hygrometricum]
MTEKCWLLRKAPKAGQILSQILHPAVPRQTIVNMRRFTVSWLIKHLMMSSENSEGETSAQSQPVYDKFNKMSFVKASVTYDCCESMKYDDQNSSQPNQKGKAGIGYSKPENSKPRWLKNKLDKDKAKADRKSFVPNQSWRSSTKVKSGWKKVQPILSGQSMKSKLNRSHCNYAQTLTDSSTGKTVKVIQVWVPKGVIRSGPK